MAQDIFSLFSVSILKKEEEGGMTTDLNISTQKMESTEDLISIWRIAISRPFSPFKPYAYHC